MKKIQIKGRVANKLRSVLRPGRPIANRPQVNNLPHIHKLAIASALAVTIMAVSWWRASAQPTRPLATLMPGSALLYLEATDFSRLLNEWNGSKVKADWLKSDNHEVFSRSNLFSKLSGLLDEYSTAAGFAPDLNSVIQIAGNESALALYEIRELQFLYVTRVEESKLGQAALWEMRSKFEARQSAGITWHSHLRKVTCSSVRATTWWRRPSRYLPAGTSPASARSVGTKALQMRLRHMGSCVSCSISNRW
jgi:hypothetical protein